MRRDAARRKGSFEGGARVRRGLTFRAAAGGGLQGVADVAGVIVVAEVDVRVVEFV
jgi:hypothetical protein